MEAYDDLIREINKASENKIAFKIEDVENPANVKIWIPTGSKLLDMIMSNSPDGGIPVSRVTEISGLESTGKSLLASQIVANTQKMGGIAVYMDTESSIDYNYMQRLGVDLDKMIYLIPRSIENAFENIDLILKQVKAKINSEERKFVTIIWDSLAATPPEAELNSNFDPNSLMGVGAKAVSKGFRKIILDIARENVALVVTNQLRMKMQTGPFVVDPYTTPYGKAMNFFASVRIRLVRPEGKSNFVTASDEKGSDPIGVRSLCEVKKTRFGPSPRKREFNIMFDSGIDDQKSWFDFLADSKIIETSGAWRKLPGIEKKFQEKDWKDLLKDSNFANVVQNLLVKANIVEYPVS